MHQLQGNKEYGSEKKGYLLKKSDGYVEALLEAPAPFLGASNPGTLSRPPTRKAHFRLS